MSSHILTTERAALIARACGIRHVHEPARRGWRRRRCTECGELWGRHGCPDFLWAIDYLTTASGLLVPPITRPPSPNPGRHYASYTSKLAIGAATATGAYLQAVRGDRPRPGLMRVGYSG